MMRLPSLNTHNILLLLLIVTGVSFVWVKRHDLWNGPPTPHAWYAGTWRSSDGKDTPRLRLSPQGKSTAQGQAVMRYADGYDVGYEIRRAKVLGDHISFSLEQVRDTGQQPAIEKYLLVQEGEGRAALYRLTPPRNPEQFGKAPPELTGFVLLPTDPEKHHTLITRLERQP